MFYDVADVKKYSRISVAVVVFYKVGKSDEISELDEDIVECALTEVAGEYSESQSEFKRIKVWEDVLTSTFLVLIPIFYLPWNEVLVRLDLMAILLL